jgi:hypothetical protein
LRHIAIEEDRPLYEVIEDAPPQFLQEKAQPDKT